MPKIVITFKSLTIVHSSNELYLVVGLSDLCLQTVASLLGISQQHRCVGLVENGVIYCSVAHAQSTLHHYHLVVIVRKEEGIWFDFSYFGTISSNTFHLIKADQPVWTSTPPGQACQQL